MHAPRERWRDGTRPLPAGLVRLSRASIVAGALGLIAIVAIAFVVVRDLQAEHRLTHELHHLQQRLDAFSVASDGILLVPPHPDLEAAYRAEAADLQAALTGLSERFPDAVLGVEVVGRMLDVLDDHRRITNAAPPPAPTGPPPEASPGDPFGESATLRSSLAANRMAASGSELDGVVSRVIEVHEQRHAARTVWTVLGFVAATVAFGLGSIASFLLLHRRVALPVRTLTEVAERIAHGDPDARAAVAGRDEIGRLGTVLNRMLDRQQHLDALTELQRAELEARARQLAEAQRIAAVGSWELDLTSDAPPVWSEETFRILGFDPARGGQRVEGFLERIHPADRDALRATRENALQDQSGYDVEVRAILPDSSHRPVRLRTEPRFGPDGSLVRMIGTVHDLTRQKREEQFRNALLDALPAQVALLDHEGTIVQVNGRWREFANENGGSDATSGVGQNYLRVCEAASGEDAESAPSIADGLRAVLHGDRDRFLLEYPCHAPDRFRWFRAMVEPVPVEQDGLVRNGAVVMHVNVTDRKLAEERLQRLAFHDRLTDLSSRHGFTQQLADRLHEAWPDDGAVVLADVVNLRGINDTYGYKVGDDLLIAIARRLRLAAGPAGLVARTGGDQFAVFASGDDGLPERLESVFERPFRLAGTVLETASNFGLARTGSEPRSVETLLREAEIALYHARNETKARWAEYTLDLDRAARDRIRITEELREALRDGQFRLHFQPKVDLVNGRTVAGEALIRWRHPERGLLSPGAFIDVAERSGLIGAIGDWVLHESCAALQRWSADGAAAIRVAVNVSIEQFASGTFADTVRKALETHDVDPHALTLEITESVFERESPELWQQLRSIHELGVRLSLDDFGTGFSSLMYLKKYPFDEIKIDRGFVRDLVDDPYSRKLVGTILSVGEAIGADVVAEGIETEAQRSALAEFGCRVGQGFLFSVPLAEEDFR
ncbi:MAG: EAL domain-containing protein, partial [Trueperaceae bacterium]